MRHALWIAVVGYMFLGNGCTSMRPTTHANLSPHDTIHSKMSASAAHAAVANDRSFLTSLLLYLPNRVLDAGDIVRAGAEVGPGMGFHVSATRFAQVAALSRISAGVGYQTMRQLPVKASADTILGAGPITLDLEGGIPWRSSHGDARIDLHLFFVGVNVAVEIFEILDFAVGLVGFDFSDDDF